VNGAAPNVGARNNRLIEKFYVPPDMAHYSPRACTGPGNIAYINKDMFTHKSKRISGLLFQLFYQNEGLLKITGCHVHCTCGNILETVQDRVIVITDH